MRKNIAIVTGGLEFNGNSVNEKAIGGSESAVIYMARELVKFGKCACVIGRSAAWISISRD